MRETGQVLGISGGTASALLTRARKRLRAYVEKERGLVISAWLAALRLVFRGRNADRGQESTPLFAAGLSMAGLVVVGLMVGQGAVVPAWRAAGCAAGLGNLVAMAGVVAAGGRSGTALTGPMMVPIPRSGSGGGLSRAAAPLGGILPDPTRQTRASDVAVTDIEPSPQYSTDHTLLASGRDASCARPPCDVLLVSRDDGRTWSALPASGLQAGLLLLPPGSRADGTFYTSGAAGLQATHDGGLSFGAFSSSEPGGYAVAAPAWSGGVLAVSGTVLTRYSAAGLPGLPMAFPLGDTASGAALFLSKGRILQPVIGVRVGSPEAEVLVCATICSPGAALPWAQATELRRAPVQDAFVVAFSAAGMAVSDDGGSSFKRSPLPGGFDPRDAQLVGLRTGTSRVLAVFAKTSSTGDALPFYSDDEGQTWTKSTIPARLGRFQRMRDLGQGRLIASLVPFETPALFGFACTADSGASWEDCSAG